MLNHPKAIFPRLLLLAAVTAAQAGCGTAPADTDQAQQHVHTNEAKAKTGTSLSLKRSDNAALIPLSAAADQLGYRLFAEGGKDGEIKMGYTDCMFRLRPGSVQASAYGHPVTLPDAPVMNGNQMFLSADALSTLLHANVSLSRDSGTIAIGTPTYKENEQKQQETADQSKQPRFRIQAASGNADSLIQYAKQFLGVPYEFGAEPYENSRTFDCSSFTRHVFKRYGVDLPRLAKDQGKTGTRVSRDQLQKGDLIFFTVPGRFESDAIPGHVGIYIGDGKFIHTWGDPGVQISNLDTGYWSDVILFMRSVM